METEEITACQPSQAERLKDRLESLGLSGAGQKVRLASKAQVAYQHYRFMTHEQIAKFNKELREKTLKRVPADRENGVNAYDTWQEMKFHSIQTFDAVPPETALLELEKAQKLGCFDEYTVGRVETNLKEIIPDPILFGKVGGCQDLFVIAQWDTDVKVEDILQADQGIVPPEQYR